MREAENAGARRRVSSMLVAATASIAACACICPTLISVRQRIFFNPSSSAPRGWYWLASSPSYRLGSLAIAHLPTEAAALAGDRNYIPRTVPVLKRLAAGPGDRVCEFAGSVRINGRPVADAATHDGQGRELRPWIGCRTLPARQYFLLNQDIPQSFDSRYFGPVNETLLLGTAVPVWTW
jgi:conjugative transfer signal peptidase TraF